MKRRDFFRFLLTVGVVGLAPLSVVAQLPRRRRESEGLQVPPLGLRRDLPAQPRGRPGQDRARDAVRQGRIRPLGEILGPLKRRFPGKVLDVNLVERKRGYIYRVKILGRDGNVRDVAVDAASGRVLAVRGRRR